MAVSSPVGGGLVATQAAPDVPETIIFEEGTEAAGLRFEHLNGATPDKYMPETMSGGGLFFDFDNDGWLDIFLVNSGSLVDAEVAARAHPALYRNNANGTFREVTAGSGLEHRGYDMGACAADYDNDGWVDLYVTSVAANVLYHNSGDGTFSDVTETAGVGSSLWSTSCAFADTDNDGDLDLYVVSYVDFAVHNNKFCGDLERGVRAYCHPHAYNGLPDILYRNNGDGTFTDITREAGLYTTAGKGLGVVFGDFNADGWIDIYVANDSVPNFLYHNRGNGTFEEVGLWTGVAVNAAGRAEASMGTDAADYDNDGWVDLFVTNLDMETNTLYRNAGQGFFSDVTVESGQGEPSLRYVGFGAAFLDFDNDGDLDVIVANGHIIDNINEFRSNVTYAERNLLFQNEGKGVFKEVGRSAGSGLALEKVSRALAVGDVDNDGDLDVLIVNNGQTADLLRNEGGNNRNSLQVRTVGTKSNRDGVGARLLLTVDGTTYRREVKAGSSYLGQNDRRVHFGLGHAQRVDRLEVRWPTGRTDVMENLGANQIVTVVEGKGVTRAEPYASRKREATAASARGVDSK